MGRRGFTVIELLISLFILIMLYLAMYGFWSKSNQERQKLACQKNLQLIYVALKIYADDNPGRFPIVAGASTAEVPLSLLVPRYSATTEIFICPGSHDAKLPEAQPFADQRISYAYYMGLTNTADAGQALMSDRQVDTSPKIQDQLIFSPDGKKPANNHHQYGGCLLFGDGHTEGWDTHAQRDLPCPPTVVLLNPRP